MLFNILASIVMPVLKSKAKQSSNKVDDILVNAVDVAMNGGDYKTDLVKSVLSEVVTSTDNTVDDTLVEAVSKALDNKEYGLQRKATGPRSNRRTGAKAKK